MISIFRRIFEQVVSEFTSKRFLRFFGGTAGGLGADLAAFWVLTACGVPPWGSNLVSATAGLLVVYFLVTKYAFKVDHRPLKFVAFVVWYSMMILFWGWVIQTVSITTPLGPFVAKLLTVPISFALNFAFSRLLFGDRVWKFLRRSSPRHPSKTP